MASRGCIRVERLQQTTFAEHWRVVFRRQYFTSRTALDRSLRGFMEFYNFERPHHGYRSVGGPRRRDRKSTRLNSSHTVISYAVFCLKKKTKTYNTNSVRLSALW